jgi:hypothetical protein
MTKPVLQTRCIGMQPDSSGHPLAPMEYVYECSEPPRTSLLDRAIGIFLGSLTVVLWTIGALWLVGIRVLDH